MSDVLHTHSTPRPLLSHCYIRGIGPTTAAFGRKLWGLEPCGHYSQGYWAEIRTPQKKKSIWIIREPNWGNSCYPNWLNYTLYSTLGKGRSLLKHPKELSQHPNKVSHYSSREQNIWEICCLSYFVLSPITAKVLSVLLMWVCFIVYCFQKMLLKNQCSVGSVFLLCNIVEPMCLYAVLCYTACTAYCSTSITQCTLPPKHHQ